MGLERIICIAILIVSFVGFGIAAWVMYPPLPACATEDSDNCYWDATTQGNGTGLSFTVVDGIVSYN